MAAAASSSVGCGVINIVSFFLFLSCRSGVSGCLLRRSKQPDSQSIISGDVVPNGGTYWEREGTDFPRNSIGLRFMFLAATPQKHKPHQNGLARRCVRFFAWASNAHSIIVATVCNRCICPSALFLPRLQATYFAGESHHIVEACGYDAAEPRNNRCSIT